MGDNGCGGDGDDGIIVSGLLLLCRGLRRFIYGKHCIIRNLEWIMKF